MEGDYVLVYECFHCKAVRQTDYIVCRRCGGKGHVHYAARWVSTTVWWNPRTWGSGYWQKPPEPPHALDEPSDEL